MRNGVSVYSYSACLCVGGGGGGGGEEAMYSILQHCLVDCPKLHRTLPYYTILDIN